MAMMRPTKATPMLAMAALVAATSLAAAQDFQVQSVVAIDGKVDYLAYMKVTSQRCAGFTPPPKVAVGEKFVAHGKSHQIGVIRAHQAEDDMPDYGIKKRDWEIYVAAETLEDIPVDQSRDRTWLRGSPKCQPDLAGSTPLLRQR